MKVNKGKIWNISKVTLLIVFLFGSIGLVEKEAGERTCTSIEVNIDNQFENYFINESDIIDILTNRGENRIVGVNFSELNLKSLEEELYKNKFIKKAEVFKDLTGSLMVNIDQSRPIARLMSNKMSDRYISNRGEVLPLSKRYTARVMLIGGSYADQAKLYDLYETEYGKNLMNMLHFIDQDKFWKAQVAQLTINGKGNIQIHTQVSKQIIEFGKPEDIEKKFRNLKIFYKEILPAKGWNSYDRVSVKFKNQIVCE